MTGKVLPSPPLLLIRVPFKSMQGLVSALLVQLILPNLYNRLCCSRERFFQKFRVGKKKFFLASQLEQHIVQCTIFSPSDLFYAKKSTYNMPSQPFPPFLGSNIHFKYFSPVQDSIKVPIALCSCPSVKCIVCLSSPAARVCCLLIDLPGTTYQSPTTATTMPHFILSSLSQLFCRKNLFWRRVFLQLADLRTLQLEQRMSQLSSARPRTAPTLNAPPSLPCVALKLNCAHFSLQTLVSSGDIKVVVIIVCCSIDTYRYLNCKHTQVVKFKVKVKAKQFC